MTIQRNYNQAISTNSYNKEELLAAIRSNTDAARAAWSILPGFYNTAAPSGRAFTDLFNGSLTTAGESIGAGAPCPICAGTDRCRLEDFGAAIFCRQGHGSGKETRTDIFEAVQQAEGLNFSDAVNRVGDALEKAGYLSSSGPRRSAAIRAAGLRQQLNQHAAEKGVKTPFNTGAAPAAPAAVLPDVYKRLRVLPVYLDTKDWNNIKIIPTDKASALPEGLSVKVSKYVYRKISGGSFPGPKLRAELYDGAGVRYAFIADGAVRSKEVRNVPGYKLEDSFPYGWQRVEAAGRVLIVESEKTVDKLNELYNDDTAAICLNGTSGAAHYWKFSPDLNGKEIIVCADNDIDKAGQKAALTTAAALFQLAAPANRRAAAEASKKQLPAVSSVCVYIPDPPPTKEDTFSGYGIDDLLDDLLDETSGNRARAKERLDDYLSDDFLVTRYTPDTLPAVAASSQPDRQQLQRQQQERGPSAALSVVAARAEEELDEEGYIEARRRREKCLDDVRAERALAAISLADFDYSRLPATFAYARQLADKYNVNPIVEVFPHLTAITNFIGQKFFIHEQTVHNRPNQRLYPRLHTVLLGSSQAGKSPIINDAVSPILDIQKEEGKKYNKQREDFNKSYREQQETVNRKAAALAKRKAEARGRKDKEQAAAISKEEAELESAKADLAEYKSRKSIPNNPLFILDDTSGEAIHLNLAELQAVGYWNGALVATDEAAGLFSAGTDRKTTYRLFKLYTAIGEPEGAIPNRPTNTTKNATQYNVIRPLTTGYLFGVQPEIFGEYLNDKNLRSQGYANRFFKFYIPDDRPEEKESFISQDYYNKYAKPFIWLFDLPDNDGDAWQLYLSDQARQIFQAFRKERTQKRKELHRKGLTDEAAFLGKSDSYVLSAAVAFHVVKLAATIEAGSNLAAAGAEMRIDAETMKLAVDFIGAGQEETLAGMRIVRDFVLKGQPEGEPLNAVDEKTLDVIARAGEKGATRSDFIHSINKFKDKKEGPKLLELTLKKLAEMGLIRSNRETKRRYGQRFFIVELEEEAAYPDDLEPGQEEENA